jgi:hypothetical protein
VSISTALYRLFGADGELLYIGISDAFGRRWRDHAMSKPWWPDVRRQAIDWHPSREDAEAAEKAAIKAERPKYNVAHNFGRRGPELAGPAREHPDLPVFFWRRLTTEDIDRMMPVAVLGGFPLREWMSPPEGGHATPEFRKWAWDFRNAFLRHYGAAIRRLDEDLFLTREAEKANPDSPGTIALLRQARGGLYKAADIPCPECAGSPPGRMTCRECGAEGQSDQQPRSLAIEARLMGVFPARRPVPEAAA